jgi:hypothetical protein
VKRILPGADRPKPRETDVQLMPIVKKPQQVRDFERVKR